MAPSNVLQDPSCSQKRVSPRLEHECKLYRKERHLLAGAAEAPHHALAGGTEAPHHAKCQGGAERHQGAQARRLISSGAATLCLASAAANARGKRSCHTLPGGFCREEGNAVPDAAGLRQVLELGLPGNTACRSGLHRGVKQLLYVQ